MTTDPKQPRRAKRSLDEQEDAVREKLKAIDAKRLKALIGLVQTARDAMHAVTVSPGNRTFDNGLRSMVGELDIWLAAGKPGAG